MKEKSVFSRFFVISFVIFISMMATYALALSSSRFADLINSTISFEFRRILASFSNNLPFSLAEYIILFSPIIIAFIVSLGVKSVDKGESRRFILNLVAVILLIYSGHTLALGVAYNSTKISEKMSLRRVEVTEDRLIDALKRLTLEVNELSEDVPRDSLGVFTDTRTCGEISALLCDSYEAFSDEWGAVATFDSTAKSVRHGSLMSYLRITGIYTFFTGEANVNSAYPSYDFIFTSAHEMAHQRGVLRENEANFVAYVVTSTSTDAAVRYSAALSMFEYVASALYKTNKDAYYEIYEELSPLAKEDIRASYAVTREYGDTFIGDISEKINDIFLKSNGTSGVISYSQVVVLTLSYFESLQ